jgi:hypothetical protein
MKTCSKCKYTGPDSDFCKGENVCKKCNSIRARIYRKTNKDKISAHKKSYYAANKDKAKNAMLKHNHEITLNEYNQMHYLQQGCCAICGKSTKGKDCHVDHCHKTNRIRGLLCHKCNTALGLFKDNPDILIKAANYIKSEGNL